LTPLCTLRSMPLVKILKRQNNFSNNWMAHVIGGFVGGVGAVRSSVLDRFGIPPNELFLDSTSGLGSNGMRPTDVVRLLRELRERLDKDAMRPEMLMPVAGVDPGTLEDRYLNGGFRGAVVAKTGTLRGVSALAGYMYTRRKGVVLFAIMNTGGTPGTFRRLQDAPRDGDVRRMRRRGANLVRPRARLRRLCGGDHRPRSRQNSRNPDSGSGSNELNSRRRPVRG
jgi:D-alanyl-D-alanine carboxypeptidase/D-alanyl-D-alanine-endopeptidase (penicillin-binding protein 4)